MHKQRKLFIRRKAEISKRDFRFFNKLNTIEAKEKRIKEERLRKEKADANAVATSEPTGIKFFSISGDWIFSPFLLRDLDIAQ